MMTLDLKAGFEALAMADHLHRIQVLLTELDLEQSFSQQADFQASLNSAIHALRQQGVRGAYPQACVLLAHYASEVQFEELSDSLSSEELPVRCIQQALNQGVPRTAFQHLHHALAGVGRIDQAWLNLQPELDLLDGLTAQEPVQKLIQLECGHDGLTNSTACSQFNTQTNYFRSETGFQHKLFGKFTPEMLLAQACRQTIPADPWVVNPHPVIDRCELGIDHGKGFNVVQQVQVVDVRQARVQHKQLALQWSKTAIRDAQQAWQAIESIDEADVRVAESFLLVDFDLQAGWRKKPSCIAGFEFVLAGQSVLKLPAQALRWSASFQQADVLVNLAIQAGNDVCIDWRFHEARPAGQLPFDEPILICQQHVNLNNYLAPVVCVGKPVLSPLGQIAGELTLKLSVTIDSESRRLHAVLSLSHSPLMVLWQAVDPLCGIACTSRMLLPESILMQWEMIHG